MKLDAIKRVNLDNVTAICLSGTWFKVCCVRYNADLGLVTAKTPDGSQDHEPTMVVAPEAIEALSWNAVVPMHR
ncbi:gp109 [Mycobacterium phage Barnyard]|uniref:Uncharacterized protein n=1 Tax=Mycobacterium phage Barnyard TaxID=205880 RepID=Q855W3_9CAUD|nr:gp109 [Mycobacterium phage Barnyard]AAN02163.1 hypothetical protein PBI_BARNYARD_109 [Mycobacterium phage Barnyard]